MDASSNISVCLLAGHKPVWERKMPRYSGQGNTTILTDSTSWREMSSSSG